MRTMRRTGWTLLLGLCAAYACSSPSRDYGADNLGGGGGALPLGGKTGVGGMARGGNRANGGEFSAGTGGMAGAGPEGGTAGVGAQGGEGGEVVVPPKPGRPGNAVVAAGFFMKSDHFSLLSSVGESPGGNGVYSSRKYRLHGGVVGTTQP